MAVIVFVISFFVYLITLCPVVYVGDSGNFSAAAFTLGICHPPGYPLFALTGKIFTFLPLDNIAYRTNLMSATVAALTAAVFYILSDQYLGALKIIQSSRRAKLVSASSALVFAFSRTFWSQAVTAEVYTLNAFFVAATFLIIMSWNGRNTWKMYLLAFIYGLSLCNHDTMLLLGPVYLIYALWINRDSRWLSVRRFILLVVFFITGLSVYLYLPLRAWAHPLLNWGNPGTWNNFWSHVTRQQYGSLSNQPHSMNLFFKQIAHYNREFAEQFAWILLIPVIAGVFISARKKGQRNLFWLLLYSFAVLSVGFIYLLNINLTAEKFDIFEVFAIPSYLIAALWLAPAFAALVRRWPKLTGLVCAAPLIALVFNYHVNDRSSNYVAYDYGKNLLRTIDSSAYFFTTKDNQVFPLSYFCKAEKMRPDIIIADDFSYVFPGVYGRDFSKLNENAQNEKRREIINKLLSENEKPIYCTPGSLIALISEIDFQPIGLLRKAVRPGETIDDDSVWSRYQFRDLGRYNLLQDYSTRHLISHFHYNKGIYFHRHNHIAEAIEEYKKSMEIGFDMEYTFNNIGVAYGQLKQYGEAAKAFRKAVEINPDMPEIHVNLGVVNMELGQLNAAAEEFRKVLLLRPVYPSVYCYLGEIFESQGKKEEANMAYLKALMQDPGFEEAREKLKALHLKK